MLCLVPGGGGFSHWHGIRICACLLGHFFVKFGIAIGGFSSETKEPKLLKLGVFWANYCKKHPIWSKLGAFLSKMVYWWVGNLAKNWYRDSQIFEVRHIHVRFWWKNPPPRFGLLYLFSFQVEASLLWCYRLPIVCRGTKMILFEKSSINNILKQGIIFPSIFIWNVKLNNVHQKGFQKWVRESMIIIKKIQWPKKYFIWTYWIR